MAPKIKLTYFDIEGVAEPVRLALLLAGMEFEDVRVKWPDWASLKSETPYGQVPVMEVDGGRMRTQSGAMIRWIGTQDPSKGLYPPERLYEVEEAIGLVGDIIRSWTFPLYIAMRPGNLGHPDDFAKTDEGKAKVVEMRKGWVETELPRYLGYVSDMIERNGGKWIAGGDGPTIADCLAVSTLRGFTRGFIDHVDVDCVQRHNPAVVAYIERFCALDEIKGRYTVGVGSTNTE